jgi:hypothetical protein
MHGGDGPIWQIPKRDQVCFLDGISQTVEAGTEDNSYPWTMGRTLPHGIRRLIYLCEGHESIHG